MTEVETSATIFVMINHDSIIRFEKKPRSIIFDLYPTVDESNNLTLKGNAFYDDFIWHIIWLLSLIFFLSTLLFLTGPLKISDLASITATWGLFMLAAKFIFLRFNRSKIVVDSQEKSLCLECGYFWNQRRIVIPFDEISTLRIVKSVYRPFGRYQFDVFTDLAYLELAPESPSIAKLGKWLGAPILGTKESAMNQFRQFCETKGLHISTANSLNIQ